MISLLRIIARAAFCSILMLLLDNRQSGVSAEFSQHRRSALHEIERGLVITKINSLQPGGGVAVHIFEVLGSCLPMQVVGAVPTSTATPTPTPTTPTTPAAGEAGEQQQTRSYHQKLVCKSNNLYVTSLFEHYEDASCLVPILNANGFDEKKIMAHGLVHTATSTTTCSPLPSSSSTSITHPQLAKHFHGLYFSLYFDVEGCMPSSLLKREVQIIHKCVPRASSNGVVDYKAFIVIGCTPLTALTPATATIKYFFKEDCSDIGTYESMPMSTGCAGGLMSQCVSHGTTWQDAPIVQGNNHVLFYQQFLDMSSYSNSSNSSHVTIPSHPSFARTRRDDYTISFFLYELFGSSFITRKLDASPSAEDEFEYKSSLTLTKDEEEERLLFGDDLPPTSYTGLTGLFGIGQATNLKIHKNTIHKFIVEWGINSTDIHHHQCPVTPPKFRQWVHYALSRSGGVLYAYLDGVQQFAVFDNSSIAAGDLTLGSAVDMPLSTRLLGYMSDITYMSMAMYNTSSFTPPLSTFTFPPSSSPSVAPTAHPSRQPTQPSAKPSTPTTKPTMQPTMQPSSHPSSEPSVQPSSYPSMQPSSQPSSRPTRPSSRPTSFPTQKPSARPTSLPTLPSGQPSSTPSTQPSALPSMQPTSHPGIDPTAAPSKLQSAWPSMQPSSEPSSQPSGQPSARPSTLPSTCPSARPSVMPTNHTSHALPKASPSPSAS